MAKFNYRELNRSIATSVVAEKRVQTIARNRFNSAKEILLEEFDGHPVTREINNGIDAQNISATLGGAQDANLFSFIGFENGDEPIRPVRDVLENDLKLVSSGKTVNERSVSYKFSLRIPKEELDAASPMPWESGNSWLQGIEKGIAGFSNYLAKKFNSNGPSRSLGGIQTQNTIRSGEFHPVLYLTELFRNFKKNFNS